MCGTDIFDSIIECLRNEAAVNPAACVDKQVLGELYADISSASPKAVQSAAKTAAHHGRTHTHGRTDNPAVNPSAPEYAPVQPGNDVSGLKWDELADAVASCRKCILCEGRRNTVFGDGNPDADLMFIGEGPGAEEDARGLPFVGAAGELLTKMISAMQFKREDVYIANIVKCRPPNNRVPEESEAETCLPYLKRQIELIKPKVIVTLGAVPLKYILGQTGVSRMRGKWMEYNGIKAMPTFHPAYLLRNPDAKALVWKDLQQVMAVFGKKHQASGQRRD